MLCTRCKQEQATLFYTQSINGKESSAALCPACAKQSGLGGTNIFTPLFHGMQRETHSEKSIKRCNLCGLGWRDILSMGKVGCANCYDTFSEELQDTIRSIHGNAKHRGLTPLTEANVSAKEPAPQPNEEETLRAALAQAIEAENYEEAARIRDAIKALKGEGI